jgi:hypothetical protein
MAAQGDFVHAVESFSGLSATVKSPKRKPTRAAQLASLGLEP